MTTQRPPLLDNVGDRLAQHLEGVDDAAWVDVISKMDEVYSRLIEDEIALERKNTELEQSQQFIDSVMRSMTDVLVVCDDAGRIERANGALCQLVGRTENLLLGLPLARLLADEASAEHVHAAMRSTRLGVAAQDVELYLLDGQSQPVPVDARCTPRTAPSGYYAGTVWVGRPTGEIRKAYKELQLAHDALQRTQQQLIHSEKMASLGQLVAGVAHELNNPISFVLGNVHAMQRYCERLQSYIVALESGQGASPGLRARLRIDHVMQDLPSLIDGTIEGANRTADIVSGLRRFSAMDNEEQRPVDVVQIMARTIQWMRRSQPPGLQVEWNPPPPLLVPGSEGQLQQVFTNLLQNAFDAISAARRDAGQVWISVQRSGERVLVRVADNGTGIPAESIGRVFDPFFTTKPVGKGTGLGLSISYGLVEQHQGHLRVRNREEGGAEFTVDLPLAPATPVAS